MCVLMCECVRKYVRIETCTYTYMFLYLYIYMFCLVCLCFFTFSDYIECDGV